MTCSPDLQAVCAVYREVPIMCSTLLWLHDISIHDIVDMNKWELQLKD